jgi:hypothetical protein
MACLSNTGAIALLEQLKQLQQHNWHPTWISPSHLQFEAGVRTGIIDSTAVIIGNSNLRVLEMDT